VADPSQIMTALDSKPIEEHSIVDGQFLSVMGSELGHPSPGPADC
jgi:hypothetical protein